MASQDRPNILWYCTDQQRWDTIRALGNPHINTPRVDEFIEHGVAFTRAYCQSPICTPSRGSFLTGRYPASTHVHQNGADFFPPGETLVTKILADAGYDCGLAGKFHISRAKGRVERRPDDGYRVFHWSHHQHPDWEKGHAYQDWLKDEKGVDPAELYKPLNSAITHGVPAELHQSTWCTEMALRFINENRDGPWLMSLNPFDPHPPFDPPKEYADRYNPDDMPPPLFRETDIERQKLFAKVDQQTREAINPLERPKNVPVEAINAPKGEWGSKPPSEYDAQQVKAYYYAMIELLDEQFGRILDSLRETGQLDNTIVIFMSDHGELLGDHGLIYKGCRFFEGLVHVPLIVSWPAKFKKGVRSDALVELVDLAPTLLEAAGVEIPPTMQGKSLLPLLSGEAGADFHKPYVISEFNDALGSIDRGQGFEGTHGSMYFDGRHKICLYHGHDCAEIYDLENDPGEFENLWDDPSGKDLKLDLLKKHFDAMMLSSDAGVPRSDNY